MPIPYLVELCDKKQAAKILKFPAGTYNALNGILYEVFTMWRSLLSGVSHLKLGACLILRFCYPGDALFQIHEHLLTVIT